MFLIRYWTYWSTRRSHLYAISRFLAYLWLA
jgi:hypothetical protein